MTEINFYYWLQGYFELGGDHFDVKPAQRTIIAQHMALVEKGVYSHKYTYFKGLWDANCSKLTNMDNLNAGFVVAFLKEYFTNVTKSEGKTTDKARDKITEIRDLMDKWKKDVEKGLPDPWVKNPWFKDTIC